MFFLKFYLILRDLTRIYYFIRLSEGFGAALKPTDFDSISPVLQLAGSTRMEYNRYKEVKYK